MTPIDDRESGIGGFAGMTFEYKANGGVCEPASRPHEFAELAADKYPYLSAKSSTLGTSSVIRKGFETTSS